MNSKKPKRVSYGNQKMQKKVNVICDLGVGGERGRVLWGGIATAVTATEYKDPMKVLKKWERKKYLKPSISKQIREEDADNSAQFEKAAGELEDSPELEEYLEEKTIEDYLYTAKDGNQYGIFKLSPRECGRLMGVNDADISKMLAVNSNSQCYKQFGNSIVVPVLMAIFSQLHIKGVTPWNELSEKERVELIKSTTRDWDNG